MKNDRPNSRERAAALERLEKWVDFFHTDRRLGQAIKGAQQGSVGTVLNPKRFLEQLQGCISEFDISRQVRPQFNQTLNAGAYLNITFTADV